MRYAESLGPLFAAYATDPTPDVAGMLAEGDGAWCATDTTDQALSPEERKALAMGLLMVRDVLVGKNGLELTGCPLPHHHNCPGAPTPDKPRVPPPQDAWRMTADSPSGVFARTFPQMLQAQVTTLGQPLDTTRVENQALFCEFDLSMNSMSVTERRRYADLIGALRDRMMAGHHIAVHGCAVPGDPACANK